MQTVRGFWLRRDMKGALSALKAAADPSATMDALHAKSSGYSILGSLQLESCAEAAGLLIPLLSSPHSRHLDAGLDALSSLLASFVEVRHDLQSSRCNRHSVYRCDLPAVRAIAPVHEGAPPQVEAVMHQCCMRQQPMPIL